MVGGTGPLDPLNPALHVTQTQNHHNIFSKFVMRSSSFRPLQFLLGRSITAANRTSRGRSLAAINCTLLDRGVLLILLLTGCGCGRYFSRLDEPQFVYRSFELVYFSTKQHGSHSAVFTGKQLNHHAQGQLGSWRVVIYGKHIIVDGKFPFLTDGI